MSATPCRHRWLAGTYGGAFCRKCDESLDRFHVVDGAIVPCGECPACESEHTAAH